MREADILDFLSKYSWIQGTLMLKSLNSTYEIWREEHLKKLFIYLFTLVFTTLPLKWALHHIKKIHGTYKILHRKQTNHINNAGLFQNIYSHWVTILLSCVKFNSERRSKVWVRVLFKVHIAQLTTWRQDISLHSAVESKANAVLVWVPNTTVFSNDLYYLQIWELRGSARPLLKNDLI